MTSRDRLDLARLRREPAHVIARVMSTDNPHGEPPPNPCPTCGRVKEKP